MDRYRCRLLLFELLTELKICHCFLPVIQTKPKFVNSSIPAIRLLMTIPLFSEYFVECWNWLKNVNYAEIYHIQATTQNLAFFKTI